MTNKQLDISHACNLTGVGSLLAYIVEIYGKDIYLKPQQLIGLLADLGNLEDNYLKLYRRAIMDDNITLRLYKIVSEDNGDDLLVQKLAVKYREANFLPEDVSQNVINNFLNAIVKTPPTISTVATDEDGEYIDERGVKYSRDGKKLIYTPYKINGKYQIRDGTKVICDRAFFYCSSLQEINIPNSVISIGNRAFEWCKGLKTINVSISNTKYQSIEGVLYSKDLKTLIRYPEGIKQNSFNIPSSVTSIGNMAFWGCRSLQEINIPNSVISIGNEAFSWCSSLQKINIPNSVTSIGNDAFSWCSRLQEINIPNSVISIGNKVFRGCSSLQAINVSISNTKYQSIEGVLYSKDLKTLIRYPEGIKQNSFNIPNSVTSIGDLAFSDCSSLPEIKCSSLQEINIPNSVISIGNGAFLGCSSLQQIKIPNSVTSIGDRAFEWCTGLQKINIPNSVTSIGNEAFSRCESLQEINIPNSVISIGNEAFSWCSRLQEINIPNSVTSIGNKVFWRCFSLQEINIPNSVISIGNNVFWRCFSLQEINIPNSVISIGNKVFWGCSSLQAINVSISNTKYQSIEGVLYSKDLKTLIRYPEGIKQNSFNIPNSVTSIGNEAFEWCTGLQEINIPNSVTSIGYGAFWGCIGLKTISIPKSAKVGKNAFNGCDNIVNKTYY